MRLRTSESSARRSSSDSCSQSAAILVSSSSVRDAYDASACAKPANTSTATQVARRTNKRLPPSRGNPALCRKDLSRAFRDAVMLLAICFRTTLLDCPFPAGVAYLSNCFEQSGRSLAAADTHRHDAVLLVAPLELAQHEAGHPRTRH